ncbi:hypothetical protein B0T25DRAFT_613019, partial [Lasiosphaeria hispida]
TDFSHCPNFALQDYTKRDIENYAAASVASIRTTNPSITRLIPAMVTRANGVFLWIKLALRMLLETAALGRDDGSPDFTLLEEMLHKLPGDLLEFYELIIQRISVDNRQRTFALLELLAHHSGPPATAVEIRDAVNELGSTYGQTFPAETIEKRARDDISTWGGGLVEISAAGGTDFPQFMHQTVLEFIVGLSFKSIVLEDVASIMDENGHSFHLKNC